MLTIKRRSKSKTRTRKFKGGKSSSGSSGRSLLDELKDKYSNSSLPNTASVDKIIDELDPRSKSEKKSENSGFIIAVGGLISLLVAAVVLGKKL